MKNARLALAGAAVAVALLSFALVRCVRRITSAGVRPVAATEAAPLAQPVNLVPMSLVGDERTEPAHAATTTRLDERPPPPEVDAPDPVQGIVWGYVLDLAGEPIAEAWLSFQDGSGEQHSVVIDERGAYSIAGLAPGTWWASAGSIAYAKQEESLEIPRAPSPLRKDFVLRAAPRIDVRLVAPDGRPFFEANRSKVAAFDLVPVATREPPGERFYEVQGSPNNPFGVGSFWQNGSGGVSLPQGFWGSVFLDVDPPVYASVVLHHLVLETQRVETSPTVVTFTLDAATLEARLSALHLLVVDATSGAPISKARIHLGESHVLGDRSSDANGEIALASLLPGRDELRVMADGFATHRAEIELEPGITNELGQLALEPEVLVSGTVSGPDGTPLEAEFAVARPRDDGTLDLDQNWVQSSDAAGRFELRGLPAARHVLQVNVQTSSPRYRPNASFVSENVVVDTRSGPVEELAIHLAAASRVAVRWAGAERESLWLRFLDERGLLREWGRFYSAAPQRFALPPGRWRLEVVDSSKHVVAEQTFTLADTPLELVLGEPPR